MVSSGKLLVPDCFRVSGSVSQSGIIIGRKSKYVIRSRQDSGQERSSGAFSSSSSGAGTAALAPPPPPIALVPAP